MSKIRDTCPNCHVDVEVDCDDAAIIGPAVCYTCPNCVVFVRRRPEQPRMLHLAHYAGTPVIPLSTVEVEIFAEELAVCDEVAAKAMADA